MEHQHVVARPHRAFGVDARERVVTGARDALARVFVGFADVDQDGERQTRDATLAAPLLLSPSIQVNIRAGHFPPADANGVHCLKVPVKLAS